MTAHTHEDTLVAIVLIVGSFGLMLPIMAAFNWIDYSIAADGDPNGEVGLCDCHGEYTSERHLTDTRVEGVGTMTLCPSGKVSLRLGKTDELEMAAATPMCIKYLL